MGWRACAVQASGCDQGEGLPACVHMVYKFVCLLHCDVRRGGWVPDARCVAAALLCSSRRHSCQLTCNIACRPWEWFRYVSDNDSCRAHIDHQGTPAESPKYCWPVSCCGCSRRTRRMLCCDTVFLTPPHPQPSEKLPHAEPLDTLLLPVA
jgi:hypothetical protein